MITFKNIDDSIPYSKLKQFYDLALKKNQSVIEAFLVASYSTSNNEVDARFVNLKFVQNSEFIFFSNYESPKSLQFKSHNQVSCVIYWSSINVQIRMKGQINKKSAQFNNDYFSNRAKEKNALAISSRQSQPISNYDDVLTNYKNTLKNSNLHVCPDYWGGFSFIPDYFEFWEGHDSRVNKRDVYKIVNNEWSHSVLQP